MAKAGGVLTSGWSNCAIAWLVMEQLGNDTLNERLAYPEIGSFRCFRKKNKDCCGNASQSRNGVVRQELSCNGPNRQEAVAHTANGRNNAQGSYLVTLNNGYLTWR